MTCLETFRRDVDMALHAAEQPVLAALVNGSAAVS
jgi:hypothetical protein